MVIKLLDCTLRDGAHVNAGNFGEKSINNIVTGLTEAGIDFVELGFFKQTNYKKDITSYPNLEEAYNFLPTTSNNSTAYAVMARADQTDITKLPVCNGKIKLIRIAFYYDYLIEAINFAKQVKAKGYLFTLNLINTPGNALNDLSILIKYANEILPYAVTIVDTFGVLNSIRLRTIAEYYNSNLDPNINIGLHLHENLSLGYALACWFMENITNRNIIIDGSLMGIGRAPGNVCTELIVNYLNTMHKKNYNLDDILNMIQENILPLKNKYIWGYSPEYFISAISNIHRSYAEYMFEHRLSLKSINRISKQIEPYYAEKFNQEYIDALISKNGEK